VNKPRIMVELTYERDTKNNARFNETVVGAPLERGDEVLGRMYLRHAEHLLLGQPQRIRVTIESADA